MDEEEAEVPDVEEEVSEAEVQDVVEEEVLEVEAGGDFKEYTRVKTMVLFSIGLSEMRSDTLIYSSSSFPKTI